ncbi:hypothetical protein BT69DRAFT_1294748 [Atractiella rhizophila]|nr:hypothetical protein BT69DRAFT_1294748 [Atractiella rhizophila]
MALNQDSVPVKTDTLVGSYGTIASTQIVTKMKDQHVMITRGGLRKNEGTEGDQTFPATPRTVTNVTEHQTTRLSEIIADVSVHKAKIPSRLLLARLRPPPSRPKVKVVSILQGTTSVTFLASGKSIHRVDVFRTRWGFFGPSARVWKRESHFLLLNTAKVIRTYDYYAGLWQVSSPYPEGLFEVVVLKTQVKEPWWLQPSQELENLPHTFYTFWIKYKSGEGEEKLPLLGHFNPDLVSVSSSDFLYMWSKNFTRVQPPDSDSKLVSCYRITPLGASGDLLSSVKVVLGRKVENPNLKLKVALWGKLQNVP